MQKNMNQQKNNPQQQESGVHKLFRDVINLAFYFFCATTVFMVMAYSDFTVEPQMTASRTDQTVDVSIEVKDKISDGYIISDFDCDTFTPTASKYGVREQWVYRSSVKDKYIYFEDGLVTAIQE